MIGSTIASYPNRVYICGDCGKHLGDRYSRLKGKKSPSVFIINGVSYCSRCADKHLIADPSAGRKPTGRKKQTFYITNKENELLREYLEELRNPAEQPGFLLLKTDPREETIKKWRN